MKGVRKLPNNKLLAPGGAWTPCTQDLRDFIGKMVAVVRKEIVVSEIMPVAVGTTLDALDIQITVSRWRAFSSPWASMTVYPIPMDEDTYFSRRKIKKMLMFWYTCISSPVNLTLVETLVWHDSLFFYYLPLLEMTNKIKKSYL